MRTLSIGYLIVIVLAALGNTYLYMTGQFIVMAMAMIMTGNFILWAGLALLGVGTLGGFFNKK